jgi:hypothetical protein
VRRVLKVRSKLARVLQPKMPRLPTKAKLLNDVRNWATGQREVDPFGPVNRTISTVLATSRPRKAVRFAARTMALPRSNRGAAALADALFRAERTPLPAVVLTALTRCTPRVPDSASGHAAFRAVVTQGPARRPDVRNGIGHRDGEVCPVTAVARWVERGAHLWRRVAGA